MIKVEKMMLTLFAIAAICGMLILFFNNFIFDFKKELISALLVPCFLCVGLMILITLSIFVREVVKDENDK